VTRRGGDAAGGLLWPALALYLAWTAATWLLEGRPRTLLRPEATSMRVAYALVANLLIGTAAALWLLGRRGGGGGLAASFPRTAIGVVLGFALGLAVYLLQGAPSRDPVVLANILSQVLVVSIAEVVVCYALVGGAVEDRLRARGLPPRAASALAVVAASLLFGVYHLAHSPPFDRPGMILLLSVVGLGTGLFFAVARDLYGTVAFHTWLGAFGVARALEEGGRIEAFRGALDGVLVGTAAGGLAILAASDRAWLRGAPRPRGR
jgi:hypothetical protein